MAISDIYNSLTFGGVNSLEYGIYISGPGVFDAPVRDVEFVDVPGRNGAIEIDKGHWNNIEVTYKAGTFGDDQSDFAQRINAFRNAVVSQIGYQRITDTYNPGEYRLGIYASGLSVDPANRNSAGEFDLVFNCKPQRYLIEGEDEITVTSGQTITNPTLYESGPLLAAEGYGEIVLKNQSIVIANESLGDITLREASDNDINLELIKPTYPQIYEAALSIPLSNIEQLNVGDTIGGTGRALIKIIPYDEALAELSLNWDGNWTPNTSATLPWTNGTADMGGNQWPCATFDLLYNKGTPLSVSGRGRWKRKYRIDESSTDFMYYETTLTVAYDGDSTINISARHTASPTADKMFASAKIRAGRIIGFSTIPVYGNPTYIDTEMGEAYKFEDGEYIDLNKYIALPSDLPKLKPGGNEITFDNTITELKITPRWWEL